MSKTTLDEILQRLHVVPTAQDIGDIWEKRETGALDVASAKQAILNWVAEEVVGEDLPLNTEPSTGQRIHNSVKAEQRNILKQHGYKGRR